MNTSHLWSTVKDELRERREARAATRKLEADLSHYRTPRDIDDLLAAVGDDESREAAQVRDILMDNLASYRPRRAG
ncbi:MAG: hypothetical protein ABIU87_06725 [Ornithinibacter sp.]